MSSSSKEAILAAARRTAQAHGYSGLNFRDLADEVGIKAASIYHHFPSKADLGAAVARRYWEDSGATLDALLAGSANPIDCLRHYKAQPRLLILQIGTDCQADTVERLADCLRGWPILASGRGGGIRVHSLGRLRFRLLRDLWPA